MGNLFGFAKEIFAEKEEISTDKFIDELISRYNLREEVSNVQTLYSGLDARDFSALEHMYTRTRQLTDYLNDAIFSKYKDYLEKIVRIEAYAEAYAITDEELSSDVHCKEWDNYLASFTEGKIYQSDLFLTMHMRRSITYLAMLVEKRYIWNYECAQHYMSLYNDGTFKINPMKVYKECCIAQRFIKVNVDIH